MSKQDKFEEWREQHKERSADKALIAMQAEALKEAKSMVGHPDNITFIETVLSASAESVAAWEEAKLKPLQDEIETLKDSLEENATSNKLIDVWVAENGRQISWGKAVQIVAITAKLPEAERVRLLCLDEPNVRTENESLRQQVAMLREYLERQCNNMRLTMRGREG